MQMDSKQDAKCTIIAEPIRRNQFQIQRRTYSTRVYLINRIFRKTKRDNNILAYSLSICYAAYGRLLCKQDRHVIIQ